MRLLLELESSFEKRVLMNFHSCSISSRATSHSTEQHLRYHANEIRPGMSGWAQINGRDELEISVKAKLDGEYRRRMSLLFDIRCFVGTFFSVLRQDGVVEGAQPMKEQ